MQPDSGFEGKEEELLHTVKAMQTRYATQRTRLARKSSPPTEIATTYLVSTHDPSVPGVLGPYSDDDGGSGNEFDLDQELAPSSSNDVY